jgi:hydroxyacylglutathione hydrolase
VNAARELIDDGIPVLDVRSRSEYEDGHIDVASHRHLGYLSDFRPDDPTQPILVHCQSGYRSSIAASLLIRNGVQKVFNLAGGYDAWSA